MALTCTEKSRRHADKIASIDIELDAARAAIDWKRRTAAEKSLAEWVRTYCVGLLLNDAPPDKGVEVLAEMERALTAHSNYLICMPRGSGKSSYVQCAALYSLATGLQKYVVVISNNQRAANGIMADVWRAVTEPDTAFCRDYPDLSLPLQLTHNASRRRQLYRGRSTALEHNAGQVVFATLVDECGNESPTSGSLISCRGITGGLRGMKHGNLRPSLVLLDDLQSSDMAANQTSVQKLLAQIRKDVMPLGGKERLSILQTATPICPDDAVEVLRHDPNWRTQVYRAIEKWPKRKELWTEYFKIYDRESVEGKPHTESLNYYKAHRAEMDEGAEVYDEKRYSEKDGHISALQKLLEMQHAIGDAAFCSEYQMQPKRLSLALEITPKQVVAKAIDAPELIVPDGYTFVAASTDLNLSYATSTVITAFKPDGTAHVIYHVILPCRVDPKLPQAEYDTAVYNVLSDLGRKLKSLGVKIHAWAIDGNGTPYAAVTSFCKSSCAVCGIPSCAFIGKASHQFSGLVRSRLRNEVEGTVLCGDAEEHVKAGAGRKYVLWNSDRYRAAAQKALLAEIGSAGGCTLYKGDADTHRDFAIQICNEQLRFVQHKADGRDQYTWNSREPHDLLDALGQSFAVAASQNIGGITATVQATQKQNLIRRIKRNVRFV